MVPVSLLAFAALQFQDSAPQVSTTPVMRAAQTSVPPAVPLARFSDMPNVEITYYDVAGHDIPEIHRSLSEHAPRDPATQQPIPATSSWSVRVALRSLTTGKRCAITGVRLDFHGAATMPRLIIDKEVPPPVIAAWNGYLRRLEARQAAQLRFAYDRLDQVERAVAGSSCGKANAAASAALARIKRQQLEAQDRDKRAMPRLEEPQS